MIANSAQIQLIANGQGSSDLELGPGDEPNRATSFGKRYRHLTSLCILMGSQIVECIRTDGGVRKILGSITNPEGVHAASWSLTSIPRRPLNWP